MSELIHTVDFFRHAHSAMNAMQADPTIPAFIGGRQNDVLLDELGEAQSEELGLSLREEGYAPTMVLSSPAKRALRTCELSTAALLGASVEPIITPDFQELDQGDWTNKPRALYDDPIIKERMTRLGWDFAAPRGESMHMVASRVLWRLGELATELDAQETSQRVAAFMHGVAIKTTVGSMLGWDHEKTYRAFIDNVSRTRLTRVNGLWRVDQINERLIPKR